ncbi:MAG: TIGR03088 family PEP-CTERM/XrtA system glycosyltransferase [Steroidobacteraceae bacterium]
MTHTAATDERMGGMGAVSPASAPADDASTLERPLIAHVVFSFDYGGLENGVVNVINGLPEDAFRHAIIALTTASPFRRRIRRSDVEVYTLDKQPGKDPAAYVRLYRLLKRLRPAVAHTRNLSTLEGALVARLAGVRTRIHGEHGWDIYDPDGTSRKYRALRRMLSPAIDRFVTVSEELRRWLTTTVGIRPAKVQRICNGVDTVRFRPAAPPERLAQPLAGRLLPADRFPPGSVVVGSVTRFSAIKDPLLLVRAFIDARRVAGGACLRLAMAGDGALHREAIRLLEDAGAADAAWLPGSWDDIPELLHEFDIFVLGSRREGISNTVLEAMSTGLPVIATATGGNLELVEDGGTGQLVPPGDAAALTRALLIYAGSAELRRTHGRAARRRIEQEYSLERMLADYESLYRACCAERREVA